MSVFPFVKVTYFLGDINKLTVIYNANNEVDIAYAWAKIPVYRLNPRLCVRFISFMTEGRLEVGRSNSLLPFSNCRLSRNGRANTFRVWAPFRTSGLSARYSTIVSQCLMLISRIVVRISN